MWLFRKVVAVARFFLTESISPGQYSDIQENKMRLYEEFYQ